MRLHRCVMNAVSGVRVIVVGQGMVESIVGGSSQVPRDHSAES